MNINRVARISAFALMVCIASVLCTTPVGAGNDYSCFNFNYYYNNGSGDYYTGYVYAPTSFKSNGDIVVGTKLDKEPAELGSQSFGGGYYDITSIIDGYGISYDKQEVITSYYDADKAGASLGVNSTGSSYVAGSIQVADRTKSYESGYAIKGTADDSFSPTWRQMFLILSVLWCSGTVKLVLIILFINIFLMMVTQLIHIC